MRLGSISQPIPHCAGLTDLPTGDFPALRAVVNLVLEIWVSHGMKFSDSIQGVQEAVSRTGGQLLQSCYY